MLITKITYYIYYWMYAKDLVLANDNCNFFCYIKGFGLIYLTASFFCYYVFFLFQVTTTVYTTQWKPKLITCLLLLIETVN